MRYPGGKGKCFQHIINLLPPHSTYIETHLGGGAVLRNKTSATQNIGIDRDPQVVRFWRQNFPAMATFIEADATDVLASSSFQGDELIYCDPPYLPRTRRRKRVYRFDYTESDHIRLLTILRTLPCFVVVSGYASDLYDDLLKGWNSRQFEAKTHQGVRTEWIWFNFSSPKRLHDAGYLGSNFRERQTVKRRLSRLQDRISRLPMAEKYQVSDWLGQHLGKEEAEHAVLLPTQG
jgi:DNA adenine methylase